MKLRDFRYERIFALFYRLTRRLSNRQIMMLLAMIVGLVAGLGDPYSSYMTNEEYAAWGIDNCEVVRYDFS